MRAEMGAAPKNVTTPVVVVRAGDPDYMQSLARGLEVIRAFEHARPTLSITEVARLTNISRAAARAASIRSPSSVTCRAPTASTS